MSSVAASFRKPPVTVWPDAGGAGLAGLILGYRMEVEYWNLLGGARGSRLLD